MNMNVVLNSQQLKQRVDDFFTTRCEHKQARVLLDTLARSHQAWIFGGMIRDMGLFGPVGFVSDVDIVINGAQKEITETLSTLPISHLRYNKFGGVRFRYQNLDFDIWSLKETWAFKEKIIPFEDATSLLKTTLMSWDAVLYDLHTETIIHPENYLEDLAQRRLELVLNRNPNPSGSVAKILRTIFTKRVNILGPQLCGFLKRELSTTSWEALYRYELAHSGEPAYSRAKLTHLITALQQHDPEQGLRLFTR